MEFPESASYERCSRSGNQQGAMGGGGVPNCISRAVQQLCKPDGGKEGRRRVWRRGWRRTHRHETRCQPTRTLLGFNTELKLMSVHGGSSTDSSSTNDRGPAFVLQNDQRKYSETVTYIVFQQEKC